jgi:SpoVK/Ycf46/Vps4 family AAA+-type ATPase
MATGEQLKRLFKSYTQRDSEAFRAAARDVVSEEYKKNHHLLAAELEQILENNQMKRNLRDHHLAFEDLPMDKERGTTLLDIRSPSKYPSDILLSKDNEQIMQRIMEEYIHAEVIRTYGLRPKTKLLFCGPPGCGKTLCAEVLSTELGLPLLYTRFDSVISSYLGETSANLRKVFDFARRGQWVLLFDEFDAIGKSRDDLSEHGELKRVVNSFLQLLDNFPDDSIVIAATNLEKLLDFALWRRFDEIVFFGRPTPEQIPQLIEMKLRSFPHRETDLTSFFSRLEGMSHADIERICFEAVKACILQGKQQLNAEAFEEALKQQEERLRIARMSQEGRLS